MNRSIADDNIKITSCDLQALEVVFLARIVRHKYALLAPCFERLKLNYFAASLFQDQFPLLNNDLLYPMILSKVKRLICG